jgi:hypothetical protein
LAPAHNRASEASRNRRISIPLDISQLSVSLNLSLAVDVPPVED